MTESRLDLTEPGLDTAIAVRHGEHHLSRRDLRLAVAGVANVLSQERKQLVCVLNPRTITGLVSYLGALRLGHAVLLVEDVHDEALPGLLERLRPDVIVGADEFMFPGYGNPNTSTTVGPYVTRNETMADAPLAPALALVARTSGSMADGKLVRLSYRNLRANAASIAAATHIHPADVVASSLRMDFSFGLSLVNSHLASAAAVSLTTVPPTSGHFWAFSRQDEVTSLGLVPATVRFLSGQVDWAQVLPSLRSLLVAGGPLSAEGLRALRTQVAPASVYYMYGQTEATARMTCLAPSDALHHEGSVGKAIPGGRIDVVPTVAAAPTGETTGEVIYEGPNVMLGYAASRQDLTLEDVTGGVLRTGDLGRLCDGMLFIEGRVDRQVKVLGMRVNLDSVELRASAAIPGKRVAATVSQADKVEVRVEGEKSDLVPLRTLGPGGLGVPRGSLRLFAVTRLPSTHSGKIRYGRLRDVDADGA